MTPRSQAQLVLRLLSWSARPRPSCAATPCARPRPVAMAPAPAARFLGWKSVKTWVENDGNHPRRFMMSSRWLSTLSMIIYCKCNVNVWDIPKIFLGHYRNTMEYYRCCSVPHPTLKGRRCQESMAWRLVLSGRGGRQLDSACPAKAPGSVREMADLVIFLGRFDPHRSDDHERQKQSKRNTRTSKIYIFLNGSEAWD